MIIVLQYRNLCILPTYHSNLDFVHELRKIFYENPPDLIAVEFPPNLQPKILQGVARLPKISIVVYFDEILQQQLYIPIFPSDSLIEAIRLAQEYGLPLEFIDLFVKAYQPEIQQMPDGFALDHLSLNEFYALINTHLLLDLNAKSSHNQQQKKQISRQNQINWEKNLLESEGESDPSNDVNAESWLKQADAIDELRNEHMAARLSQLMEDNPQSKILVVIGLAHWAPIKVLLESKTFNHEISSLETNVNSEIYNVTEEVLAKISVTTPNIVFQFNNFRMKQKKALDGLSSQQFHNLEFKKFNQFHAISILLRDALKKYEKEYHERVSPHKINSLMQFIRNLARVEMRIRPQLFEIVLGAKAIINEDFAWKVWESCKNYPPALSNSDDLEDIKLTNEGILIHGKYFKIRRNIPIRIQKIKLPLKPKPKEEHPGEWRAQWNKHRWTLVSHVPEDIFEEKYFQHIRKRTLSLLKEDYTRTFEFKSTLMDGIDFRETIRKWPFEQKIYVKEERTIKGRVDAVVIIFDPDEKAKQNYRNRMVWYAEHEEESDLAFYSTLPGADLVGPGISRIELGGVVSFFPPRGIPNIWDRKFLEEYPLASRKADRLLMAALIYAQKSYITYVASQKPKDIFYQIARILHIHILFIPIDHFNPVSLRALRNLHILAGKHTRRFAHKYIRKRKY